MQVANSTAVNPTPGDLLRQWMKRPVRIFYQSEANECGFGLLGHGMITMAIGILWNSSGHSPDPIRKECRYLISAMLRSERALWRALFGLSQMNWISSYCPQFCIGTWITSLYWKRCRRGKS